MTPATYDHIVFPAAAEFGVPPEWLLATIGTETSFQTPAPRTWAPAVNEYAYGPMQILYSTARGLGFTGSPAELERPEVNIAVGAAYLADIRSRVGNDFRAAASEYYSGDPTRWRQNPEVARHVSRAVEWLQEAGGHPADLVDWLSAAVATFAGLIAFDFARKWVSGASGG